MGCCYTCSGVVDGVVLVVGESLDLEPFHHQRGEGNIALVKDGHSAFVRNGLVHQRMIADEIQDRVCFWRAKTMLTSLIGVINAQLWAGTNEPLPGRVWVSLTHCPGLGSGTLDERTGNQAELDDACSLNLPKKAVWTSAVVKTQMAEPVSPFWHVVKTA